MLFRSRRYVFQIFGQEEKLSSARSRALLPATTRHLRGRLTGDLGSGSTGGQIYLHDIARGEGTATSGFYLAIDRNFTGLDEHARLGAVLYQVR